MKMFHSYFLIFINFLRSKWILFLPQLVFKFLIQYFKIYLIDVKLIIHIFSKKVDTDLSIYANTTPCIFFEFRFHRRYNIFFAFWSPFSVSHFSSSFENSFISEYMFRSIFFQIYPSKRFSCFHFIQCQVHCNNI